MVGGSGQVLARGRALFVVYGVLHLYRLRLLSFVMEVLGTDPGVSSDALV